MRRNIVLFVDDEVNILASIRRAVVDEAFDSRFASSGQEALAVMEKEPISVLVTDMRMPGMDGLSLLKLVKEQYPGVIKIVLSGYTQLSQVLATINQGDIFKFIAKPWKMKEELLDSIAQALEYYNLRRDADDLRAALEKRNNAYKNVLKMMDDRVVTIKHDIDSIKKIDQWILQYLADTLITSKEEEQIDDLAGKILLLRGIHAAYMDTWPSMEIAFDGNKLLEDIKTLLLKFYPEERLELKLSSLIDSSYYGNYRFLLFAFSVLVKYIPRYTGSKLACISKRELHEDDVSLDIVFVTMIEDMLQHDVELFDFVIKILNKVAAGRNVTVKLQNKGKEVLLGLHCVFSTRAPDKLNEG